MFHTYSQSVLFGVGLISLDGIILEPVALLNTLGVAIFYSLQHIQLGDGLVEIFEAI